MAKPQAFEGTRVGFHGERVAFACGRLTTQSRKGTGGLTDQIFFVVLSLLLGGPPVTAAVVARAVGPGPPPQSFPKPSAESAAPESVVPAPHSLFFVRLIFLVGCIWACVAEMLGLFGCCSRNRAAALASVVPSPSEGAPSGQPQQEAFTEVPDAL